MEDFHVCVVGAGMSGICMGIKLKQAGIPFAIYEKNDSLGGTWYENDYPDCGVDIQSQLYSFSFEPAPPGGWSHFFAKRDELLGYFEYCADKYGIREHIEFGTSVDAATFEGGLWQVNCSTAAGRVSSAHNVFVSCVGQLNRPAVPHISGADTFEGDAFHTARWGGRDLIGRRVALIGTGCSAVQTLRTTAQKAEHVYVFQRTPNWIVQNPNYYKEVPEWMNSLFNNVPFAQKSYRRKLWLQSEANYLNIAKDKNYPSWLYRLGETLFPMKLHNEEMQKDLTQFIAAQCGDDEEGIALARACTPNYPPMCKRVVIDNDWFETLRRDNVTLITDPILGIEPDAVVTEQGDRCNVDAIVYATGFKSNEFLQPMEITGTSGRTLQETWGREPRAYLGVVAPPSFPNMYMLYGPNTNSGHHSIIAHAECQVNYVLGCCKAMIAHGVSVLDIKPQVFDNYIDEVNERMGEVVWETGGCDSWYIQDGKVVNNSPWAVSEMAWMLRKPALEDFMIDGGAEAMLNARL